MTSNKNKNVTEQGYDEMPYHGYPFEYNRPENLKSVGSLFGVDAPKLETARILELGCSDGGNLFRFAELYPKSYTLGVDLSKVEIENGQKILNHLKLKNVDLKAMSITDLDESFGKFDYIICHGVFSWVPDFVKDSILEVSKKLLNKNGLAFISYNTLPGWNMINSVRELMMFHSTNFSEVKEKVTQSRAALSFIQESLEGQKTPHAEFMQEAAKVMAGREDQYIRHEYLAEENKAFYFNEFIAKARENDLEYVGDTDVHRMYIGNMPKKSVEKLGTIKDIVRAEQYMDFLNNTQFRCTVLSHKDTNISRSITDDTVQKFNYFCKITPLDDKINIEDGSKVTFYLDNNKERTFETSAPEMKAILTILSQNNGNPLSVNEITDQASKLVPKAQKQAIKSNIVSNFANLIFSGAIKYIADKPVCAYTISSKPRLSKLALLQIQKPSHNGSFWITNSMNQVVAFPTHQVPILKALDGKNTIDQINKIAFENLKNGTIDANVDGKKITDDKQLTEIASSLVAQTLETLRVNFSLIA
jgi:methyltransferase-like protein/2-polyprenyl-3-methyl-5-hydroxy-6-metoxy-1,4-benzoquinol methylase